MKKVVCIVDNHIYLKWGETYNIVNEFRGFYKLERVSNVMVDIYIWDKKLFVSLEEFRNKKIEQILT